MEREGIDEIDLDALRDKAHVDFHNNFNELLKRRGPKSLDVEKIFEGYTTCLEAVRDAISNKGEAAVDLELLRLGDERVKLLVDMVGMVEGLCDHCDQGIKEAATAIRIVLGKFQNVDCIRLVDQTEAINRLVEGLSETNLGGHVQKLVLWKWTENVKKSNENFDKHVKKHNCTRKSGTTDAIGEAREDLDKAYYNIIKRLNAHIVLNDERVDAVFVGAVNDIIDDYAVGKIPTRAVRRKGAKNNEPIRLGGGRIDIGSEA